MADEQVWPAPDPTTSVGAYLHAIHDKRGNLLWHEFNDRPHPYDAQAFYDAFYG